MEDIWNFVGKSIQYVFEDLGLTEYYPGKLTVEKAKSLARKRVLDKKDIPWCFIENVLNPSYDGRTIFFVDQNACENSDDFDWGTETNPDEEDEEIYSVMDVTVAVLLCCDNTCKQVLAHMLSKSELSVPLILPDNIDKDKLIVQTSVLRGMTQDGGYDRHIPIVSFLCVNGDPVTKTQILNILLGNNVHKPFFDFELERNLIVAASVTKILLWGLIEAALSQPHECTCQDTGICSCTFKKVLLFLNLYGISRNLKTQENLVCEISSVVTVIVDTGKLAGDKETINNVKQIIDKSKQTIVVFTKKEEDSLDQCKKGFQELKEVITGTGAQVVILYNRRTGHQDNMDNVRGWMKKKINAIMEVVDSDNISLKERFENLDIAKVKLDVD